MTVEDTMVNRDKAGELKRVLEKVFHERCGLPVEIEYEYVAPTRAKASIERELQAKQEAERMTAKVAAVLGLNAATGTDGEALPAGAGDFGHSGHGNGAAGAGAHGAAGQNGSAGKNQAGSNPGANGQNGKNGQAGAGKAAAANGANGGKNGDFSGGEARPGQLRSGKKDFKKNDWSSGGDRQKSDNPDV